MLNSPIRKPERHRDRRRGSTASPCSPPTTSEVPVVPKSSIVRNTESGASPIASSATEESSSATVSASDRGGQRQARSAGGRAAPLTACAPGAGHRRTQLLGRGVGRVDLAPPAARAASPAMVSDMPMSSSRSAETSSTASPAARAWRSCSQMAACAPTSTPRVGWLATSSDGRVAHLAADDELLLVAAGQREGGRVDAGGAHVVLGDDPLGVRAGAGAVDQRARGRSAAAAGGRGCGSPTAARPAACP